MQEDINKLTQRPASNISLIIVLIISICAVVLFVHWPALSAEAESFDDSQYFFRNPLVRNPSWNSAWRFLAEVLEPSTVKGYYQPLSMISLMIDYAIGGQTDSLTPFHRTSLLLHAANTALIIILLYQLFGNSWIAAAVGLLFGVHPLTVEPIPWVGERKTLLAAFFTLCSVIFYVRYARKESWKSYVGCFLMYILALMSKPTSTPLPAMLLLMDFWPLRRLKWRTVLEKLPFFVIGGISAVITYISQSRTASVRTPHVYGLMRIPLVICHDIIFYLYKMIRPVNLSSHYPFPEPFVISTPVVMIGVIGTCMLLLVLILSLRWTRSALTGFAIFFVMIFPTMQMLQFSAVIASDKFAYLPSIGLLMVLAAFLSWICSDGLRQHIGRCAVVAVIVLMLAGAESVATRRYLVYWQDTISLFEHIVKLAPNAASPRDGLGVAYGESGDPNKAIEHFREALRIEPNNFSAQVNLGIALAGTGRYDEAMMHYKNAMRLPDRDSSVYRNLAVMLADQGRIDDAINLCYEGLKQKLQSPAVLHSGLGTLFLRQGKIDEAIYEFQIAVEQQPDSAAFNNLGIALGYKGRTDEAMECHKKAIGLDPKNAEARYNLANILLSQNKLEQAISEYTKAVQINPKYTNALINLAVALMRVNRFDESIKYSARVVEIEPNNIDAHYNLAVALWQKGRLEETIKHFTRVLDLEPNYAEVRYNLASILIHQHRLDEAANEYRQLLKFQPQDADAHCLLGNVLAMQGQFDGAADEYRQALKINPQHPEAQEGLNSILHRQDESQTPQ